MTSQCCDASNERGSPVDDADRHGSRPKPRNESLPFVHIALGVALDEEVRHWFKASACCVVQLGGVRPRVLRSDHATRPKRLDPLVVAVDRLAAVVDVGEGSVLVGENDHRGVDIACFADGRINPYGTLGVHLDDLTAGYEASHVEVVDRHIVEHAARHLHVFNRRWFRVTARDLDHVQLTNIAIRDGLLHGGMGWVESSIESNLDRDAGSFDRGDSPIDFGQVQRHRLLQENCLACLGSCDCEVDVGVGAGANRHRVDIARHDLFDRVGPVTADAVGHGLGAFGVNVIDRSDFEPVDLLGDDLGVHFSDASRTEHGDGLHRSSQRFLLAT